LLSLDGASILFQEDRIKFMNRLCEKIFEKGNDRFREYFSNENKENFDIDLVKMARIFQIHHVLDKNEDNSAVM
jgi:hypothetical protein